LALAYNKKLHIIHILVVRTPCPYDGPSWSYGSWIYNYICNQCLSPLMLWVLTPPRRGVLDTTLCDKVCQWLAEGRWLSLDTPVSSTNKTARRDITEILLKVALNNIIWTLDLTVEIEGNIWSWSDVVLVIVDVDTAMLNEKQRVEGIPWNYNYSIRDGLIDIQRRCWFYSSDIVLGQFSIQSIYTCRKFENLKEINW
jgi:hypothetical protein